MYQMRQEQAEREKEPTALINTPVTNGTFFHIKHLRSVQSGIFENF